MVCAVRAYRHFSMHLLWLLLLLHPRSKSMKGIEPVRFGTALCWCFSASLRELIFLCYYPSTVLRGRLRYDSSFDTVPSAALRTSRMTGRMTAGLFLWVLGVFWVELFLEFFFLIGFLLNGQFWELDLVSHNKCPWPLVGKFAL